MYQELCQVLRHNDKQSDLEDSRAYSLSWNIRERFLEDMPRRRNAKSKGNLVAFLHLEHMASKVIVVGEGSYVFLEVLDSLEFCEISHS